MPVRVVAADGRGRADGTGRRQNQKAPLHDILLSRPKHAKAAPVPRLGGAHRGATRSRHREANVGACRMMEMWGPRRGTAVPTTVPRGG